MKKKEFKLGDKVIVTKSDYNGKGTVVCVSGDLYLIKFDKEIGTYNYNASFKYKSYKKDLWCVTLSNIKHIKTSITKKQMLKRIEALEALAGVEKKTELEVGKWYWLNTKGVHASSNKELQNALIYYNGEKDTYAFNFLGEFFDRFNGKEKDTLANLEREATPQEVEEALIKEAKKRGIENEAILISTDDIEMGVYGRFSYSEEKNKLYFGGASVFDNGKWAEVIKNDDKFAELKEAHKNGAVIQFRNGGGIWEDCEGNSPYWYDSVEYRIKPDDKPKDSTVLLFRTLKGKKCIKEFPLNQKQNLIHNGWKYITNDELTKLFFKQ